MSICHGNTEMKFFNQFFFKKKKIIRTDLQYNQSITTDRVAISSVLLTIIYTVASAVRKQMIEFNKHTSE